MASAAYLASRYLNGPAKKKKRKSSKKHDGLRLIQEDDWDLPASRFKDDEDAEDAPQVVHNETERKKETPILRPQRGAWAAVAVPTVRQRMNSHSNNLSPTRRESSQIISDEDLSPPRRSAENTEAHDDDLSPPRRQQRVDSDDDNLSPPRRQQRVDSDDDDLSPPRRQERVDSDDDDLSPPRRQQRVDSDDDDDLSPPRRQQRVDSDDDDLSPPRRQQRVDSDDDDLSPPRRPINDEQDLAKQVKTLSSHKAGLLSGPSFRETEAKLRIEREAILNATANEGQGETIYRDRKGHKLDLNQEKARIEAEVAQKKAQEKAEFEWRRGTKQKADEVNARQELEAMKHQPFARTADDVDLNTHLKSIIHDDDPMADYFRKKQKETGHASQPVNSEDIKHHSRASRPRYKGPTAAPNRFGIAPGYRWDGIDRGNGWEARLISHQVNVVSKERDRYAWSSADM